jgi:hypothetical protein
MTTAACSSIGGHNKMGAGKFYAAHAAIEKADPVGYRLAIAENKHERQLRELRADHAAELASVRRELAAAQATLRQAQADADHRQRQFEIANAACRQDLETARAALNEAKAQNEQLRRRLKQCDAVSRLIAAATQEGSD